MKPKVIISMVIIKLKLTRTKKSNYLINKVWGKHIGITKGKKSLIVSVDEAITVYVLLYMSRYSAKCLFK